MRAAKGEADILLDLLASSPQPLRVKELPFIFRARRHGKSKLDTLVAWEYLLLLVDKLVGHTIPVRFALFAMIGGLGLVGGRTVDLFRTPDVGLSRSSWRCLCEGLVALPYGRPPKQVRPGVADA